MRTTRRAALSLTTALLAHPVAAQDSPSRPIRVIIPFPPGGPTDVTGRIVAAALSAALGGQAVVVENRAGAASVLGTEAVVRSPPDGHTLLFGSNSTFAVNAALMQLPFDPARDLDLLGLVAEGPQVLVARAGLAASLPVLLALARARPGVLTFASSGPGGIIHVAGELFRHRAGLDLLHVPYRGGGPAVTALLSGEVDVMVNDLSPMLPMIREGRLVALAVAGERRAEALPDVPTFAEAGVPGVVSASWFGLALPAGAPALVRTRLALALEAVLASDNYRARLRTVGLDLPSVPPPAAVAFTRLETEKWRALVREARVRVE